MLFATPILGKPQNVLLDQNCNASIFEIYTTKVSLSNLPEHIQAKIDQVLAESLYGFQNSIVSKEFLVNDVVSLLEVLTKTNPRKLIEPIPNYVFLLKLIIPEFENKEVCIKLHLDKYGQILKFTWPVNSYNFRTNILGYNVLKKKVTNYAISKNYNTQNFTSKLYYNQDLNTLIYRFVFKQDMDKEYKQGQKNIQETIYKEIEIDVKTGIILLDNHKVSIYILDKTIIE